MHKSGGGAHWVAYEDNAAWRLGQVAAMGEKSLRLCDGEKIPLRRVWLSDLPPPSAALSAQVAAAAAALPADKLWRAASGREALTLQELAAATGEDSALQQLAVLQQVLAHPLYFQRRGKRIHPAAAETLHKALAAQKVRAARRAEEDALCAQLAAGTLPPDLAAQRDALLFAPDKTAPLYRALKQHCGGDGIAFAAFFVQHKILRDAGEYFEQAFLHKWQPDAPAETTATPTNPPACVVPPPPLPQAAVDAFSIDDAGTTEIDDAFSITALPQGGWQLGIHIAAPALCLSADADAAARQRMLSVYFPHQRHLMLPPSAVAACSLSPQAARPALSLYLQVHPEQGTWHEDRTQLEAVQLAACLTPQQVEEGSAPPPLHATLATLQQLTEVVAADIPAQGGEGGFKIDAVGGCVTPRARGGIARVVEVLMRCANTLWGRQLAASGGGLFRHNGALQRTPPAPPYAWLTSPLRRYVDLANQRQLLAHLAAAPPPCEDWSALRRTFYPRAVLAQQYQKILETHWALQILQQQGDCILHGTCSGRGRVRLNAFPLSGTLPPAQQQQAEEGKAVRVRVAEVELLQQRLLLTLAEATETAQ